jgi:hypothetical protein
MSQSGDIGLYGGAGLAFSSDFFGLVNAPVQQNKCLFYPSVNMGKFVFTNAASC